MCALPCDIPDLAEALAYSARRSVKDVADDLEFLVRDNPFGFDTPKMFEVAQWQKDLSDELEKLGVDGLWIDPSYRERFDQVASTLESEWKQLHRSFPDEKWLARADDIEQQADPLIALEMYDSLRNDMTYLEQAMRTAAEDLDQAIQSEIDRRRGK